MFARKPVTDAQRPTLTNTPRKEGARRAWRSMAMDLIDHALFNSARNKPEKPTVHTIPATYRNYNDVFFTPPVEDKSKQAERILSENVFLYINARAEEPDKRPIRILMTFTDQEGSQVINKDIRDQLKDHYKNKVASLKEEIRDSKKKSMLSFAAVPVCIIPAGYLYLSNSCSSGIIYSLTKLDFLRGIDYALPEFAILIGFGFFFQGLDLYRDYPKHLARQIKQKERIQNARINIVTGPSKDKKEPADKPQEAPAAETKTEAAA